MSDGITTYCLGVGCMTKCSTCLHEQNWQALNQMPNPLRLAIQGKAQRINEEACQITSGLHYTPTKGHQEGRAT